MLRDCCVIPWRGHNFNTEDIDSNVNFIYIDALGQKIPHRITANDYHLSPKTTSIDGLLFGSVRGYSLPTSPAVTEAGALLSPRVGLLRRSTPAARSDAPKSPVSRDMRAQTGGLDNISVPSLLQEILCTVTALPQWCHIPLYTSPRPFTCWHIDESIKALSWLFLFPFRINMGQLAHSMTNFHIWIFKLFLEANGDTCSTC